MVRLSCSYIPYEIPLAAGMPVTRDLFEGPIPEMEGHLPQDFCPYARAFIRQYGNNSIVVVAGSCDAMRRTYDVLDYWNLAEAVYYVDVPLIGSPEAVSFYAKELENLSHKFLDMTTLSKSEFLGRLMVTINFTNEIRRRLSRTFNLMFEKKLSAAKATQLAINISKLPAPPYFQGNESFIQEIDEIINQVPLKSPRDNKDRPSIPVGISGTCLLDLSVIKCIENAGLDIAFIDSCISLRAYDFNICSENNNDPFHVLAEAYLNKPACPRMFQKETRVSRLLQLASDYDIQGLIYFAPKFCDQAYYDSVEIRHGLKSSAGFPMLFLEGQYGSGKAGQAITRVEAFQEMLETTYMLRVGR
ncbi:MAG: 2-hydroxyacyl-CoA dehydratase [Firmicutes bacterium]|nr:2-hydroxyacyl-CoA dehydratase [Bacillota bacterium]